MRPLRIILLTALVALVGCTTEVDFTNLRFAPEDAATVEDDIPAPQGIPCSKFVSCALNEGGEAGFAVCLHRVNAAEEAEAVMLESCRKDLCAGPEMSPDSEFFEAGMLVDCLFKLCTDRAVECAVSDGTDSCLPFAVGWKNLDDGASLCEMSPAELCYFELLEGVSPDNAEATRSLINCLYLYKQGFQSFETNCLPFCH